MHGLELGNNALGNRAAIRRLVRAALEFGLCAGEQCVVRHELCAGQRERLGGEEHRFMRDGKTQFGIMSLEDYSGKYEFAFYRKEYEQYRPMMFQDYFLLIRGKVQSVKWYKKEDVKKESPIERIRLNITSIVQLNEVAESLKEIHFTIPIDRFTNEFVDELVGVVKHSRGKSTLRMTLVDDKEGVSVTMHAKRRKVALTDDMVNFIERNEIEYSFG